MANAEARSMLKITLSNGELFYRRKKKGEEIRKSFGLAVLGESKLAAEKEKRAGIELGRIRERIAAIDRGFSLEVFPGETVLVTGNNGSGKTSFLEAVLYALGHSNNALQNYWAEDVFGCVWKTKKEEINLTETQGITNVFYFDFEKHNPRTQYKDPSVFFKLFKHGSHRQALEEGFAKRISECEKEYAQSPVPRVFLLDEPENGMDTDRQTAIKEWLWKYIKYGDIALIATNCEPLISSKFPILNLSKYPARKEYK